MSDIKSKIKDIYEDAVEYFTGEDKTLEIVEKAHWRHYHEQVSDLAEKLADDRYETPQFITEVLNARRHRDEMLKEMDQIEEALDKED